VAEALSRVTGLPHLLDHLQRTLQQVERRSHRGLRRAVSGRLRQGRCPEAPPLVLTSHDDPATEASSQAWEALRTFDEPPLTDFSDRDPVTTGAEQRIIGHVIRATGQPDSIIEGAGHFSQEGDEEAHLIVDSISRT
jgi:hypothetical protein